MDVVEHLRLAIRLGGVGVDVACDALAEIIRLRACIRELDQALSDAEWRLANPGT